MLFAPPALIARESSIAKIRKLFFWFAVSIVIISYIILGFLISYKNTPPVGWVSINHSRIESLNEKGKKPMNIMNNELVRIGKGLLPKRLLDFKR